MKKPQKGWTAARRAAQAEKIRTYMRLHPQMTAPGRAVIAANLKIPEYQAAMIDKLTNARRVKAEKLIAKRLRAVRRALKQNGAEIRFMSASRNAAARAPIICDLVSDAIAFLDQEAR